MKFSHLIRLYTSSPISKNQALKIEGEDFYYLKSVMRLRKSDIFRLFNEIDGEFIVKIEEVTKSSIVVYPIEQTRSPLSEKELILGICMLRPERMIEAIKSAVQLGVTQVIPLISERTQYKKLNREKIEKCIIQATEQCERFKPAVLAESIQLTEFCELPDIEQIIFACESEETGNKISKINEIKDKVAVLIGPEGGFSSSEVSFIKSYKHVNPISLGSTVLRAETAAVAALACAQMIRE